VDGLLNKIRFQIADIGSFFQYNPRILSQPPIKLAVAHIHSIDSGRPALQEAIGKSPSGATNVETDFFLRVKPEMVQRGGLIHDSSIDMHQASQDESRRLFTAGG
jgi:hypothetical protein